jgi:hypothetical protein
MTSPRKELIPNPGRAKDKARFQGGLPRGQKEGMLPIGKMGGEGLGAVRPSGSSRSLTEQNPKTRGGWKMSWTGPTFCLPNQIQTPAHKPQVPLWSHLCGLLRKDE